MGGNKQQRSIGSTDKVNDNAQGGDPKASKKEDSKKTGSKQQQRQKLSVLCGRLSRNEITSKYESNYDTRICPICRCKNFCR